MELVDRVALAFKNIRREDFLPKEVRKYANINEPLHIGFNQTNSQPATVDFMLRLLDVQPGDRVLDVGSGSGWTTGLLAYLTGPKGSVVGVEKIPQLAKFGQKNLSEYRIGWVKIVPAVKSSLGFSAEAPYDKILVSASAAELPKELIDQLKIHGKMIIPIGNSVFRVDKLATNRLDIKEYPGFAFVPLVT